MKHLFVVTTLISAVILLYYSKNGIDTSLAIVAEVEPQKTAISFPKSVRIKSVSVKPGQNVNRGDLLLEVDRPDLLLDIEKLTNDLKQVESLLTQNKSDYTGSRELLLLRNNIDTASIQQQINVLSNTYSSDTAILKPLKIRSSSQVSNYTIKIESLEKEKELRAQKLQSELRHLEVEYINQSEQLLLSKQRLEAELLVLEKEKAALKQYAPFSGTVGSVTVQLQELVPPYQTIISVYEKHPTIIKAYLNELATADVALGAKVQVTSINRGYKVEGKVVEIGSRIVSYPKQMKNAAPIEMWGKEIFVEIGADNTFLSGEKVYVIINSAEL